MNLSALVSPHMAKDEKVLTLHPEGKNGVRIDLSKYDMMRGSIISELRENGEMRWKDLLPRFKENLRGKFEGSISWYYTSVKLDLQARGTVHVIKKNGNQYVSLSPGIVE